MLFTPHGVSRMARCGTSGCQGGAIGRGAGGALALSRRRLTGVETTEEDGMVASRETGSGSLIDTGPASQRDLATWLSWCSLHW